MGSIFRSIANERYFSKADKRCTRWRRYRKKKVTYKEVFEFAVAEIGLSPKEFYSLTFYEYSIILAGHYIRNSKAWEHTRQVTYMLYAVNSTDRVKTPITEFMPLLTDPPPTPPDIYTEAEKLELLSKANERLQLLGKI